MPHLKNFFYLYLILGQKRKREGDDYGTDSKRRNEDSSIPEDTKYELRILLQTKVKKDFGFFFRKRHYEVIGITSTGFS
jgi:hypothetical protein